MSYWEDLEDVYAEWRWEKWENDVESGYIKRGVMNKIKRFDDATRVDFSYHARLTRIISVRDMHQLEQNFLSDLE